MIKEVVEGISASLIATFGKEHTVYAERVEQGLKMPCFSIGLLACEAKAQIGGRTRYTLPFHLLYFSSDGANRPALWEVGQKMRRAVETIDAGGVKLRGTKIKTDQLEGIMRCYVQYQPVLTERDAIEMMGDYRGTQLIKQH